MDIQDKHIVITGGASGLGLEFLRQLVTDNMISVIGRPSAGLTSLRDNFPDVARQQSPTRICVVYRKPDDGRYGDLDAFEAVMTNRLTLHQQEGLAITKRHKGKCFH